MSKMQRFVSLQFILLFMPFMLLVGAAGAQGEYPQPDDRYVNDYAGVISAVDETALRTMLSDLEGQTGIEATVLTIDSIRDYPTEDSTIEDFATSLFNFWGIGDAERDDGLLVLVAVEDRQVWLEVGSGYGREFDGAMQRVIDEEMLPRFREERYSQGIYEGTRAAVLALSGETFEPPGRAFWQTAALVGLTLLRYWWVILFGALVFLFIGIPISRRVAAEIRYRIPPPCTECGRRMKRIAAEDIHRCYTAAQALEIKLGSVTYGGWKCPGCSHVDLSPRAVLPVKYTVCPECHHRTVSKYVSIKPAKPGKKGRKRETFTCQNCNHVYEKKTTFSYKNATLSSSSSSSSSDSGYTYNDSSSSSWSGGNDSFGGGSSSGGGASGSW